MGKPAVYTPITRDQRQKLVLAYMRKGYESASDIRKEMLSQGIISADSERPYALTTIATDMRELRGYADTASEMIGREVSVVPLWKLRVAKSVDATQTDYQFWDRLRRGKAEGFSFGGLFRKRLTSTLASYIWRGGVAATLSEDAKGDARNIRYTNKELERFLKDYRKLLLQVTDDSMSLGDQFVAVNPDASLSVISPQLVEKEWNPVDYRDTIKVTVTTRMEKYEIKEEYDASWRTVTVRSLAGRGPDTFSESFDNLIGRIPVVHFPNDRGGNEIYGHPIDEALFEVYSHYDTLMLKGLDGGELMGNPLPVVEGAENPDQILSANAPIDGDEDYTDVDGNEAERAIFNFDTRTLMVLGKGAGFKFASPPVGFTADIISLLGTLFLLMLEHVGLPEAVWGAAIQGSRASADTQMPPFWQFIEARRLAFEGDGNGEHPQDGLRELIDVWLRTRKLTDPRIVVGPVDIDWPYLDRVDWEVALHWTQFLASNGMMDAVSALRQSGLVKNPTFTYEKAQQELKERQRQEQAQAEKQAQVDLENQANLEKARQAGKNVNQQGGGQFKQLALPEVQAESTAT
jgi:hypothetical protein